VCGSDKKFDPHKAARKNRNPATMRQSCDRRALGKAALGCAFRNRTEAGHRTGRARKQRLTYFTPC
jgi:hypothetical protein